jgi:hypothetical protein
VLQHPAPSRDTRIGWPAFNPGKSQLDALRNYSTPQPHLPDKPTCGQQENSRLISYR